MPDSQIILIVPGIAFIMLAYEIVINDKKFIKFCGKIGLFKVNKKWQEFRGTYLMIALFLLFLIFGFGLILIAFGAIGK